MSNEWMNSTTVQIKANRREEIDQMRLRLSQAEGRVLELREVVDTVLAAGLAELHIETTASAGETPASGANWAETGRDVALAAS